MRTILGISIVSTFLVTSALAKAQQPVEPPPGSAPPGPPSATPMDTGAPPPVAPANPPSGPMDPNGPHAMHHHMEWHGGMPEHGEHGWGAPMERPWAGAQLFFSIGYIAGDFSALQQSLQAPGSLGPGYDTAPGGVMYGGGAGIFVGPLWLGGKIYGLHVGTSPHGSADTSLTGTGGGGELGFAFATSRFVLTPFVGLGGFHYNLNVKNKSPGALPVYTNDAVAVNSEQDFTASLLTGEVGFRASHLMLFGEGTFRGGLTLGAEAGYTAALTRDAWAGTTAAAPESASIRGGYFRIIIGGAAELFHDKKEPQHAPYPAPPAPAPAAMPPAPQQ